MVVVRRCIAAVASLLAGLLLAGSADAATPAGVFNAPGQRHADVCVRVAVSPAALRFADGTPTGFEVTNGHTFAEDGRCPAGSVRLDLHETIPSSAGPLAFHRGGNGYVDQQNVKYGELAAAEILDALPAPRPSSGGRGAPCTLSGEPAHRVDVRSIPAAMHYKRPQDVPDGSNSGTSFEHYGDPGADQGARTDIHYSYLIWSALNVGGGGMVRTLLAPGQIVRPCDVESVTMSAWDRDGAVNGSVTARYVRITAGTCPLYGWMVWSHDYHGDSAGPVAHATPDGSPPPDPAPDPGCPVAEAASPPLATTGGALPNADGEAALAATVDPKGVPTTYWFEYGTGTGYGARTPVASISSAAERAVWSPVAALEPGTTYHYRVAAASDHGTTYGADATFKTPPPPVPELSGLRLDPTAFRRARSRRGHTARIRFTLSKPAAVTLKFERKAVGVLRAGVCRRAPSRGVPRGARRCRLWVRVGAALRQLSPIGASKVKFGGWVGSRALPPGRYRLRAVPVDAGRSGSGRTTGFTLR